ncbi:MAG: type II toxin-antitoxin system RelE/ParE family toxin [Bacteroidetes bacterium]|nr:type II toxin-antitoxin system RelE/ParE family toxin [Bacteroidota bacterium]
MEIRINKKFLKELSSIQQRDKIKIERFVFEESLEFKSLKDVPGLKKLKGHSHYYRIRLGQYRAGLKFEDNILTFERLIHRKDIYKYYP